jgi:hypothetical protein
MEEHLNPHDPSMDHVEEIRDDFEANWPGVFPQELTSTVSVDARFDGQIEFEKGVTFGPTREIEPRRNILERYIESHGFRKPYPAKLLAALVLDDTQLCWARWSDWIDENFHLVTARMALEYFHSMPRLSMYLDWLREGEADQEMWYQLSHNEVEYRHRFGDATSLDWYQENLGLTLEPRSDLPVRKCIGLGTPIPVQGKMLFGRRRKSDPDGVDRVATQDGIRVIIAEEADSRISREQLWVMRLSHNVAAVGRWNVCNGLPREERIELLRFPFRIEIEEKRMEFN